MKFRNHPCVTVIKKMDNGSRLNFCRVSVEDFVKEIKKLSPGKVTQSADLAVKLFGNCVCSFFSDFVDKGNFLLILKLENIALVFKKGYRGSKVSYLPVNIFPVILKIFEKLLYTQIKFFIDPLRF